MVYRRLRRTLRNGRREVVFMSSFLMQIGQTAACNRLHHIGERLARRLLMMRDRVLSDELHLTQEFLSHMLGTRLAGVNEANRTLTLSGLVAHRRNAITILDRAGLKAAACECYAFAGGLNRRGCGKA